MPPRIPLWPSSTGLVRGKYICRTCLLARQAKPSHHSPRFSTPSSSPSSGLRAQHKSQEIDDFYALLLSDPLPTPARTTRQPTQPPPATPSEAQPLAASSSPNPPPPPSISTNTNNTSSSSQASTSPPPTTTTAESPDQLDVAARARLVFGSRHLRAEERSQRAAERKAASTLIGSVRVPPRPSEPDNCCMSGCVNCVWDLYREELEEWAAARRDAEKSLFQGTKAAGGSGADLRSQQQVTGGAMAEGAVSMDDDGGGSASNWDAEDALLPSSGSRLFESVPVGIREFMRTEKRLGRRRKERERRREEAGA